MTVTFPEWEVGQAAAKGMAVTYTQTGRVDVFVALTDWAQYAAESWSDPAGSDNWLELDNYNGSWAEAAAYPKGHIVDLADSSGTLLWYIAATDVRAGRRPGEVSEWLLFGGARTPPVPDAALLPTRWRAPLTIITGACVDSGVSLAGLPTSRQVLIRLEPPSGTDPTEQERLILTADLLALPPVAVGDDLTLTTGSTLFLSEAPSITDRALVARTATNRLLVQIPDKPAYPVGQAARLTFAHEDAWPLLFFDAISGDFTVAAADDGTLAGTRATPIRNRLAPTPTEATRGQYVRQSTDGETYELTVDAPATSDFSYSGNPADSGRDQVRFLIGDTIEADMLHTNAELDWLLTQHSDVYRAAVEAMEVGISKVARLVDTSSGDLKVMLSQRAEGMTRQATVLRELYETHGGVAVPYAGGLSRDEQKADDRNTDLVGPRFTRGQFSDSRLGVRRYGRDYFTDD